MYESKRYLCRTCNNWRETSYSEWLEYGPDMECMRCVERAHRDFMATAGRRLGIVCTVPHCSCKRTATPLTK